MPTRRRTNNSLPEALRVVRDLRGLTQEDFSLVSSRTYVSGLERGLKSPTLKKIEQIASVLNVHPLTLLAISYASAPSKKALAEALDLARKEADELWQSKP
ncbi:helix-turn-helix domain-containing protein [Acidovorax sp. NPDC077693]|uniref:helix-turn-helix domain-containing protein n=1 Tax=unclassified Acidovorax TaxID=2684926 RepID=UPI0037C6B1FB